MPQKRGAPEGNQHAAKKGGPRVPACLSIADERKEWVVRQLQQQGITEPTQAQIIRFVKDLCYAKIDEAMRE